MTSQILSKIVTHIRYESLTIYTPLLHITSLRTEFYRDSVIL